MPFPIRTLDFEIKGRPLLNEIAMRVLQAT